MTLFGILFYPFQLQGATGCSGTSILNKRIKRAQQIIPIVLFF